MTSHLIIPGLGSSGSGHWQTWLERVLPDAQRVQQWDWNAADLPVWSARIRHQLSNSIEQRILIGHSFGALAAAQAAIDHSNNVAGVLLVAPADPVHFDIEETGLAVRLGVPAIVVASRTDRWLSFSRARQFADVWGADLVDLGDAGHINAESGFGPWLGALQLLQQLEAASEIAFRKRIRVQPQQRLVEAAALLRSAGFEVTKVQNSVP